MRSRLFAGRNARELLRDPLSYLFCIALPVLILLMMTVINASLPGEAQVATFQIASLAPGILVFGFTFLMLFACLQVSKDRSSAFLLRLYASPLTAWEYLCGYAFPLLTVGLAQCAVTFAVSAAVAAASVRSLGTGSRMCRSSAAASGTAFSLGGMALSALSLIPAAFLFIGLGVLLGTLFSDKSGPPVSSLLITAASVLGGIWMDVEAIGGTLRRVCLSLPFYHAVRAARGAANGTPDGVWVSLAVVTASAALTWAVAAAVFRWNMRRDIR